MQRILGNCQGGWCNQTPQAAATAAAGTSDALSRAQLESRLGQGLSGAYYAIVPTCACVYDGGPLVQGQLLLMLMPVGLGCASGEEGSGATAGPDQASHLQTMVLEDVFKVHAGLLLATSISTTPDWFHLSGAEQAAALGAGMQALALHGYLWLVNAHSAGRGALAAAALSEPGAAGAITEGRSSLDLRHTS